MRFSELEGARIGVWGAGREIASFAAQLSRRLPSASLAVVAFDESPATDALATLEAPAAKVVSGDEVLDALSGCEVVVRSPGVSIHRPEIESLIGRGIVVTTATALWLAEREGRGVIGVTGTKGKSTTAALAAHLIRASGRPVELAGNIGRPALDLLDCDPGVLAVVELSSYHVADLTIGPEVAAITNLFAEHIDWHGSEAVYRAEKLQILGLPGVHRAVLPAGFPELAEAPTVAERVLFGQPGGWDLTAEGIAFEGQPRVTAAELPLPGEHNALNLCAALTALEAAGVAPPPDLPGALAGFEGLGHRLQTIAERDGLTWVDDSISTTPESALAALASFPDRPLVLLGGGQDRGQDYGGLGRELARIGANVVGMGTTGPRLLEAAARAGLPAHLSHAAGDLAEAVALARACAAPGAVVLLSPAAPSYDNFKNFEERGERFAALVSKGS
ncbi:MAG TPA: UDP-N-acetylmuramoyl-L-alanine--D-glutamate ligase [Solirubrobacteraceae bacterium]|nr:UDP-N-acetylmuramoyl-L-alanine--D-glutamate ligase [Solirubrobacteraceae bacterium]